MRITPTLYVNKKAVALVKRDVRLELSRPGRAAFHVTHDEAAGTLRGLVALEQEVAGGKNWRTFTGYIERYQQTHPRGGVIFARELSAALIPALPINLRRAHLGDVLQFISAKTGLEFIQADKDYSRQRAPWVFNHASGLHLMDCLGAVFGIDDYIWQQQADGAIYVGSYADSRWASRQIALPWDEFKKHTSNNSAEIAPKPPLRPGVVFTMGNDKAVKYVQTLQDTNDKMTITWSPRLNAL